MRPAQLRFLVIALLATTLTSGCAYTVAGTRLQPLSPPAATFRPRIEHSVGEYSFNLDGGKMITSNFAGRLVNYDIMAAWRQRGYITGDTYVDSKNFSGGADYNVTLSGNQYGEASLLMQIVSGLTLYLVPHSVTQHYDLHYTVVDVRSGRKYEASVQETDKTYFELFLIFALPVAARGHIETMHNIADHLYEQLHAQGAFQGTATGPN